MHGTALILRAPQRAAATVKALRAAGIRSACIQLIETVWPADVGAIDECIERWLGGEHDWVVFTSVNTVQVLAQRLAGRGIPAQTRLAAVGHGTAARVTELLQREVDFLPQVQSAAGMLAQWHLPAGTRVLYPHGDLAAPTLAEGLRGWSVQLDEVIAYRTVDAGSGGVPIAASHAPEGVQVLPAAALADRLPETDLLIFAAPSIVRRFVQLAGSTLPARTRTIAIGEPTASALAAAGLPVHEVAAHPTPEALAASARKLLKTTFQNR